MLIIGVVICFLLIFVPLGYGFFRSINETRHSGIQKNANTAKIAKAKADPNADKSILDLEHELLVEFGVDIMGHQWECPKCIKKEYLWTPNFSRYNSLFVDTNPYDEVCYKRVNGYGQTISTHHTEQCRCEVWQTVIKTIPKAEFTDGTWTEPVNMEFDRVKVPLASLPRS